MAKAQSMPLNVIIVAILVLIVLVVLILIFAGRINLFQKGLDKCTTQCVDTAEKCTSKGTDYTAIYMPKCDDDDDGNPEGSYCCTKT